MLHGRCAAVLPHASMLGSAGEILGSWVREWSGREALCGRLEHERFESCREARCCNWRHLSIVALDMQRETMWSESLNGAGSARCVCVRMLMSISSGRSDLAGEVVIDMEVSGTRGGCGAALKLRASALVHGGLGSGRFMGRLIRNKRSRIELDQQTPGARRDAAKASTLMLREAGAHGKPGPEPRTGRGAYNAPRRQRPSASMRRSDLGLPPPRRATGRRSSHEPGSGSKR